MNNYGQIQNLEPEQVFSILQSTPQGLDAQDAADRLRELGPNSIEVRDRWKPARSLFRQFTNFFTLLLFAASLICFVADSLQPGESMAVLGWALSVVAVLNALVSFIQEYRAERAMAALQGFLPQTIELVRNGRRLILPVQELVPGDLIHLAEGDRIPADARVVAADGALVNNAALTGEAQPVVLRKERCAGMLLDSNNIAFAGCLILRGTADAVVFATGLRTEFGKLAHLSQALTRAPSPLARQTAHMVRVLTGIAVTLGMIFFVYGVLSGRPLWVNLVFMMGIIVANVPEGLLPTLTLSLAMGSLRMADKNVLVTHLNAVEGLGAVQIICTDKTGTLTENRLAVAKVAYPDRVIQDGHDEFRSRLLKIALCASDIRQTAEGLSGDPLDIAIAQARDAESGVASDSALVRSTVFPFDVEKKRAAGICLIDDERIFAVKGAWEVIRPLITCVLTQESAETCLSEQHLLKADTVMSELAGEGLRVVAVAYRPLEGLEYPDSAELDRLETDLVFAGFLAVKDPLREEVPDAVASCQKAGIEVLMITGDHPETALSIARDCGINADPGQVMNGAELEDATEAELAGALTRGVRIFARTSPAQKMKIVMALKQSGKVVAMTGDGVNDAPALKAADIGIAMGKSGTDVARASAQVILLDDNFASIIAGIEEGRTVFNNIRKFTNYVLVSNGPEILPYLLYILFPVPLALTVIQILSIDLGTDIIPSMALGREPPEADTMTQPPRSGEFRLLSPGLVLHSYLFLGLIEAFWSLGLFFFVLVDGGWSYGLSLEVDDPLYRSATGMTLATILLMQIGNLLGRRHRQASGIDRGLLTNRLLLVGIVIQIVFSWAVLYLPPVQQVLGTGPVSWQIYLIGWLGIPLIFGTDLLRKRFLRSAQVASG